MRAVESGLNPDHTAVGADERRIQVDCVDDTAVFGSVLEVGDEWLCFCEVFHLKLFCSRLEEGVSAAISVRHVDVHHWMQPMKDLNSLFKALSVWTRIVLGRMAYGPLASSFDRSSYFTDGASSNFRCGTCFCPSTCYEIPEPHCTSQADI